MRVFPIVLVWCMVVGAAFAVFSAFLSGIGSFYHPNADGAHLRAFNGLFRMILLGALLFLAFLIMSKRDQWAVWVQAAVLVVFAAGAFGVERAYVALNPQPSHFLIKTTDPAQKGRKNGKGGAHNHTPDQNYRKNSHLHLLRLLGLYRKRRPPTANRHRFF